MKNQLRTVILGTATLLTSVAFSIHAQIWETLVNVNGQSSRAIMVDPMPSGGDWPGLVTSGEIPGLTDASGTPYKVWRLLQSDSPTPTTPDLAPLHASGSTVYSMTKDLLGNLYWVGTLNPLGTGNKWIVRRSTDSGTTWQELMRWDLAAGMFARARGVTVDDQGRIYVCGIALDAAGHSHWLVRRSDDQGQSWTTSDLFQSSGQSSIATGLDMTEGLGITFVPASSGRPPAVIAVGSVGKRYSAVWTVMRSTDAGQSWQLSERWVPKSSGTSRARKVLSDNNGRLFVLGDSGGRSESDPSPWVVRMSRDAGITWDATPIFGPWSYGPCVFPLDFTIDSSTGDIWIAGVVQKQYGNNRSRTYTTIGTVVRIQETTTGPWTQTEFPVTAEALGIYRAEASAITADAAGHVYVSGGFKADDASPWTWFVQRMAP